MRTAEIVKPRRSEADALSIQCPTAAKVNVKLYDGTTTIALVWITPGSGGNGWQVGLSGIITNPAGYIRMAASTASDGNGCKAAFTPAAFRKTARSRHFAFSSPGASCVILRQAREVD